jgi:hypothetical protein
MASDSDSSWKKKYEATQRQFEALQLENARNKEEIQKLKALYEEGAAVDNERSLLATGKYFTQLKDVLGNDRVGYNDGFHQICGRIRKGKDSIWHKSRFPAYTTLELQLMAIATNKGLKADDMSYVSASVSKSSHVSQKNGHDNMSKEEKAAVDDSEKNHFERARSSNGRSRKSGDTDASASGVKLINAGTVTNAGHLLAGNDSCSPTMGIFVQAIIGKDFEAVMNRQIRTAARHSVNLEPLFAKLKKVLQQLAYHQRAFKGFCNLVNNLVQVPKGGHEMFFDKVCDWIIVPIMPLDEIIDWYHGKGGYWVMFIAGGITETDTDAYMNFLQASTSAKKGEHVYVKGERERCSKSDVEEGIKNLTTFITAFADLATGRETSRGEKKLTPFDLITQGSAPSNLEKLKVARDKLQRDKLVTVPTLKAFDEERTHIIKLFLEHEDSTVLPEPMAVAAKGALNFMEMNDEKATPGCGESSCIEEESNASSSKSSSIGGSSLLTPKALRQESSDIPEYVTIVTPSPTRKERSNSTDSWNSGSPL